MPKQKVRRLTMYAILPIVVLYILFEFVFTFYKMPDQTMEDTIKKGEWVYINKLSFGTIFMGIKLPGITKIENGDLVYMLDPSDTEEPIYSRKRIISRIIAKPHDLFSIEARKVIVNGKEQIESPTVKQGYRVVAKDGIDLDTTFFNKYHLTEYLKEGTKTDMNIKYQKLYGFIDEEPVGIWEIPMTAATADEVAKDTMISYARFINSRIPGRYIKTWPYSNYWSWNRWNITPPFEVPGKGISVPVTYRTIRGYEDIISKYEGNKIDATLENDIYINGNLVNTYTVKDNYYVVLSDNRDRYYDTRTWGLVPEKYIIGKVMGKQ